MHDTSDRYPVNVDAETFVDLEALEQHVSSRARPEAAGGPGRSGLATRAAALNLISFAPTDETRDRIVQAANRMSTIHPCRLILFTAAKSREEHLSLTNVYAACESGSATADAPSFERMEIPIHSSMLDQLPLVLQPLLIPELPAFLWWPEEPPFDSPGFQALARSLNRIVIDSATFSSVARLHTFSEFMNGLPVKCALGDLNWQRLQPWRELTAQYFDIQHVQWALSCVREVEVEAGRGEGNSLPTQAILYICWLACCLGWEVTGARQTRGDRWYVHARDQRGHDIRIVIRTRPTSQEYADHLTSLSISARDTEGHRSALTLNRSTGSSLIRMYATNEDEPALSHVAHHPLLPDEALLVPVLESTSRDHVFEAALGIAAGILDRFERPART